MKTQVRLSSCEVQEGGVVGVRLVKEIVDDDGKVLASDYHRTVIPAGITVKAQMSDVNDHLDEMGYPALSDAEIAVIQAFVDTDFIKEGRVRHLKVLRKNAKKVEKK